MVLTRKGRRKGERKGSERRSTFWLEERLHCKCH